VNGRDLKRSRVGVWRPFALRRSSCRSLGKKGSSMGFF
jgi:hypothetical protein